jgi:glycine/D-amino acid oxidase-like deaminating enzyme
MHKADVLIVGAGLIGCATALHLARAGADVMIADAGDIGMGASGQNAGSENTGNKRGHGSAGSTGLKMGQSC